MWMGYVTYLFRFEAIGFAGQLSILASFQFWSLDQAYCNILNFIFY